MNKVGDIQQEPQVVFAWQASGDELRCFRPRPILSRSGAPAATGGLAQGCGPARVIVNFLGTPEVGFWHQSDVQRSVCEVR
jgi:hypothetical protein